MSAPTKNSYAPSTEPTPSTENCGNKQVFDITAATDDIFKRHRSDFVELTTGDDSITEDTSVDYSTELEYSVADEEDDCDDDNDSIRQLLKQAHERLENQSLYEEVKLLRTQLNQKLEIVNKNNELEHKLSKARQTIEMYKQKEKEYNEEKATCEMDFMRNLNEMCAVMEEGFANREKQIVELQNRLNEKGTKIGKNGK